MRTKEHIHFYPQVSSALHFIFLSSTSKLEIFCSSVFNVEIFSKTTGEFYKYCYCKIKKACEIDSAIPANCNLFYCKPLCFSEKFCAKNAILYKLDVQLKG